MPAAPTTAALRLRPAQFQVGDRYAGRSVEGVVTGTVFVKGGVKVYVRDAAGIDRPVILNGRCKFDVTRAVEA
jgi:hypothetical protein